MVDLFVRQNRLVFQNQLDYIVSGNIAGADNGALVPGETLGVVHGFQATPGDGAADGDPMQHVGDFDVVEVFSTPGKFVVDFFTGDGGSNSWHCPQFLFLAWQSL